MSNLLFDTPYWILGALAIVGIALFVTGNNRTDATLRSVGAAIVGVGLLMFVVSWFVDTSEEKCVNRSKQLVKAVEKRDWDTFNSLVSPRAKLSIIGAPGVSTYRNREEILEGAKAGVERHDLRSAKVYESEAKSNVDYISVDISVYTEQGHGILGSLSTAWQLDWQETDDGWVCVEIIAKRVGNQGGEALRRVFPPGGGPPNAGPGFGGFGGPPSR
jgi:hypothetical protein